MKNCRVCNCELVVGENWYKSSMKKHMYVCIPCLNKQIKQYQKNNPEKYRAWAKRYEINHAQEISEKRKLRNIKLKQLILDAYGQYCHCMGGCTETAFEFMTIEHMDGMGAKHIIKGNKSRLSGGIMYRWLRDNNFPSGYTILCWNCNCSRGLNGYCPHEKE